MILFWTLLQTKFIKKEKEKKEWRVNESINGSIFICPIYEVSPTNSIDFFLEGPSYRRSVLLI